MGNREFRMKDCAGSRSEAVSLFFSPVVCDIGFPFSLKSTADGFWYLGKELMPDPITDGHIDGLLAFSEEGRSPFAHNSRSRRRQLPGL